jgi:outer membrane immunogenic protein
MRKLLLSTVAMTALAVGPVAAADMRAPVYKAPPFQPASVFSWSGCYIGGHVGGGYAWTESINVVNTTAFGDFVRGQGFANPSSGVVGGGHLGCNYQFSRLIVIGIEGSYDGANIRQTILAPSAELTIYTPLGSARLRASSAVSAGRSTIGSSIRSSVGPVRAQH